MSSRSFVVATAPVLLCTLQMVEVLFGAQEHHMVSIVVVGFSVAGIVAGLVGLASSRRPSLQLLSWGCFFAGTVTQALLRGGAVGWTIAAIGLLGIGASAWQWAAEARRRRS